MLTRRWTWVWTLVGATSLAGVVLAAALIWLLATEPITLAVAIDRRDVAMVAMALIRTLGNAVRLLAHWL